MNSTPENILFLQIDIAKKQQNNQDITYMYICVYICTYIYHLIFCVSEDKYFKCSLQTFKN